MRRLRGSKRFGPLTHCSAVIIIEWNIKREMSVRTLPLLVHCVHQWPRHSPACEVVASIRSVNTKGINDAP